MTFYKMTVYNDNLEWFKFETDDLDDLESEKRRVKALGFSYNVTEHKQNETQEAIT